MRSCILGLFLPVVFLAGCSSLKPLSPREAFLVRTADRTDYAKLYEVSPESLREKEERILRITKAIIRGIRRANEEGTPLNEHLDQLEHVSELFYREHLGLIQEMEEAYDPKTDVILFFHYWPNDENQDYGYIVTRDGVTRKIVPGW
jgi:predicted phosphohydrolase